MPFFAITSPDEARYAEVAREMAASHHYLVPRLNGIIFIDKPPFFYWVTALFFHVFGVTVSTARSVTSLCALVIAWGLYHIGVHWQLRRTGLLAACLFLASPITLLMAHFVNLDMMVACFITLSITCFLSSLPTTSAASRYRLIWLYAAYTWMACAILTKGLIGLVIPAMAIGGWVVLQRRWSAVEDMRLPTGLAWCFLLCAPWFFIMQWHFSDFSHFFFYTQQVGRYLSTHLNDQNPVWFYPVIISGAFILWLPSLVKAIVLPVRQYFCDRVSAVNLLMWVWALGTIIFFSVPRSKTLGYILPALVPLAWLLADQLMQLKKTDKQVWWQGGYWLLLGLAVLGTGVGYRVSIPAGLLPGVVLTGLWLILSGIFFMLPVGRKLGVIGVFYMVLVAFVFNAWLSYAVITHSTDAQRKSIAPLIKQLKSMTSDTRRLMSFNAFYYDLPFTLQHKVQIVSTQVPLPLSVMDNWLGQFHEGLRIEPHNRWFSSWQDWQHNFLHKKSKQPLYIVTENKYIPLLKALPMKVVAQYHQTCLLRVSM